MMPAASLADPSGWHSPAGATKHQQHPQQWMVSTACCTVVQLGCTQRSTYEAALSDFQCSQTSMRFTYIERLTKAHNSCIQGGCSAPFQTQCPQPSSNSGGAATAYLICVPRECLDWLLLPNPADMYVLVSGACGKGVVVAPVHIKRGSCMARNSQAQQHVSCTETRSHLVGNPA